MIELNCPTCHCTLRVENSAARQTIRCGGCMTRLQVPEASEETPRAEPVPLPDDAHDAPPPLPHYDDYPQRRPRRRRRPPPPSGRGAAFWILLTFGLLTVGCCGFCGLVALVLPGPQWRTHNSVQGGFKVDLPGTPKNDMKFPGVKSDPNMKAEGTMLWSRMEEYVVVYGDVPSRNERLNTDDQLLDEAVKGMESEKEFRRMLRNERITISGFPARELEFQATDGGTYMARFVVADTRFFALVAGGRFSRTGNENSRRFLNSFAVTDPNLKLKGVRP